jgi:hypothetical protein
MFSQTKPKQARLIFSIPAYSNSFRNQEIEEAVVQAIPMELSQSQDLVVVVLRHDKNPHKAYSLENVIRFSFHFRKLRETKRFKTITWIRVTDRWEKINTDGVLIAGYKVHLKNITCLIANLRRDTVHKVDLLKEFVARKKAGKSA